MDFDNIQNPYDIQMNCQQLKSAFLCHQWGFTQGKSTTGALLDATDQWHRQLDLGLDICVDYIKALILTQFPTEP